MSQDKKNADKESPVVDWREKLRQRISQAAEGKKPVSPAKGSDVEAPPKGEPRTPPPPPPLRMKTSGTAPSAPKPATRTTKPASKPAPKPAPLAPRKPAASTSPAGGKPVKAPQGQSGIVKGRIRPPMPPIAKGRKAGGGSAQPARPAKVPPPPRPPQVPLQGAGASPAPPPPPAPEKPPLSPLAQGVEQQRAGVEALAQQENAAFSEPAMPAAEAAVPPVGTSEPSYGHNAEVSTASAPAPMAPPMPEAPPASAVAAPPPPESPAGMEGVPAGAGMPPPPPAPGDHADVLADLEGLDQPPAKKSMLLPLALAFLIVALAAAAAVYFFLQFSQQDGGAKQNVPVIAPPQTPAKVRTEPPENEQPAPVRRKKIYDRIPVEDTGRRAPAPAPAVPGDAAPGQPALPPLPPPPVLDGQQGNAAPGAANGPATAAAPATDATPVAAAPPAAPDAGLPEVPPPPVGVSENETAAIAAPPLDAQPQPPADISPAGDTVESLRRANRAGAAELAAAAQGLLQKNEPATTEMANAADSPGSRQQDAGQSIQPQPRRSTEAAGAADAETGILVPGQEQPAQTAHGQPAPTTVSRIKRAGEQLPAKAARSITAGKKKMEAQGTMPEARPVRTAVKPVKPQKRPVEIAALARARKAPAPLAAETASPRKAASGTGTTTGGGPIAIVPLQPAPGTPQPQTRQPQVKTAEVRAFAPAVQAPAAQGPAAPVPVRKRTNFKQVKVLGQPKHPQPAPLTVVPPQLAANAKPPAAKAVAKPTRMAALAPAPRNVARTATSAGQAAAARGGYVVQLAAFRSREDALRAWQRVAQKHGRVLRGLQPIITKKTLGDAGTFYRLSVGTIASRQQAQRLCNTLIARGEPDCLVRKQ